MLLAGQQAVRVAGLEGQAQHTGDRGQGDIRACPRSRACRVLPCASIGLLADHAFIRHRCGIGTGPAVRSGQSREYLRPRARPRQVMLFLLLGPKCISSSPGPSEVGTITLTAAVRLRVRDLGDQRPPLP